LNILHSCVTFNVFYRVPLEEDGISHARERHSYISTSYGGTYYSIFPYDHKKWYERQCILNHTILYTLM
jgi:hypothetical protein